MLTPSVVVFDLGKVLVDFDYGISARKLSERSKVQPEDIRTLLDHSPLLYKFETGHLTNEEFYGEVRAASGFSGTMEEFCAVFADIFSEIKPMIDMQAALKRNGVPTYIFSNTNGIAIQHIQDRFPFFGNFDGYFYSYEHKAMKPAPKSYEVIEQMTGKKGKEILYLDDRADNIEGGLLRGWNAILHETPEKTIPLLRQHGLPV